METMYSGKVNSPETALNGGIDDSVQTIDIVDGSVLPDAPNLAVIGLGEDAETILYANKAANQLTNVTRGFQGTAKAWDSGIPVARLFTAYDYDSLKTNITELSGRKLSDFAATSSSELAGVISDEEGSGKLVFNISPALTTPDLGVADATQILIGDVDEVMRTYGILAIQGPNSGVEQTSIMIWGTPVVHIDAMVQLLFGDGPNLGSYGGFTRYSYSQTAYPNLFTVENKQHPINIIAVNVGVNTNSPSGDFDINAVTDADPHLLFSENDATKWNIYNDHTTDALEFYANTTRRYSFGADGTAIADEAWDVFSPVITATGKDLLAVALEGANKPVKPYEGIPVVKSDDELFDIVVEEREMEIDKKDGLLPLLDGKGKPIKEKIILHKDIKVYRDRRPDEFKTQAEVDAEFDKYSKSPAKIAIANARYLEYLTGIIDDMQIKIDELEKSK